MRIYKFSISKWFPNDSVTDVGCKQKRCLEQITSHEEFKLAKNILPETSISMQNCIIYRNQYMIWGRLSQILKMHPKILTLKWFEWKEVVHFLSFVEENHWTRNTKKSLNQTNKRYNITSSLSTTIPFFWMYAR